MSESCGLIQHIAGGLIQDTFGDLKTFAETSYNEAQSLVDDLERLDIAPVNTNVDFEPPGGLPDAFSTPNAPLDPSIEVNEISPPGEPNISAIAPASFDDAPTNPFSAPNIQFPTTPDALIDTVPSDDPIINAVTVPAAPTITIPDVPTQRELTLPDVPTVSLPTFSSTAPVNDLVAPGDSFSFVETPYSSDVLTDTQSVIETWLNGGTGLPDAIWQALWDKGRDREAQTGQKAVQEATENWAARGFAMPGGVLNAQIVVAQQQEQDAANQLSRDIAIQQAQMEVENLRHAVTQGIALENILINLHTAQQQRIFEGAQFTLNAATSIFNSKVNLFNASLQAYRIDVEVYRAQIEAERQQLELYKAQLEGQALIGQINKQDLEGYEAQVSGLLAQTEIYKSQIEGVAVQAEIDKTRVDVFKARVDAFTAKVNAKESEFRGFAAQVQGEGTKAQVYQAELQAFASEIEAYKSRVQATGIQKQIEVSLAEAQVNKYVARVSAYRSQVEAESARIRSLTDVFDGKVNLFTSEIAGESARVQSDTDRYRVGIASATAAAELELKAATVNIEQILRITTLEAENLRTIATIQSTLAAAAMAAMNISASVTESAQNSTSCSETYSHEFAQGQ